MKKTKKIVFDDTDVRHAKLKIRLQHDSLTQAEFFRAFITGYIEQNPLVIEFITQYKRDHKVQSKKSIKKNQESIKHGKTKIEQFGIVDEELEDIFDLIASEHPDL